MSTDAAAGFPIYEYIEYNIGVQNAVFNTAQEAEIHDRTRVDDNEPSVTSHFDDGFNNHQPTAASVRIELKQNDVYALKEPQVTTANESYNYPATINAIEMRPNDAYTLKKPEMTPADGSYSNH